MDIKSFLQVREVITESDDDQMSHDKTDKGLILDHCTLSSRSDLDTAPEASIPLEQIWIQIKFKFFFSAQRKLLKNQSCASPVYGLRDFM